MNISQAARRSGVSAKMIRHYEAIGLISAERRSNNYRTYAEADIAVLRFILHARELAFPLEKIRQLLALWRGTPRCDRVLTLAREHVCELERKAESYRAMAESLQRLASGCPGDGSPACPILDAFSAADQADSQASDRATADRATADRATADRATADRAAAELAAADRAAADLAAAERAAADRATDRELA